MTTHDINRRTLLSAGLAVSAGLLLPSAASAVTQTPQGVQTRRWRGSTSANGWPIITQAKNLQVEGSTQSVWLAEGNASVLLLYAARRFNYEIDSLRDGDLAGHSTDREIREPYESNYLSGTALTIRSTLYPIGGTEGFYPQELAVIRDIIKELDGTVAWGGDEKVPKESHFQVNLPPGHPKIKEVVELLKKEIPKAAGAGSVNNFTSPQTATPNSTLDD